MAAQDAEAVRVIVEAWQATLDRCGMDLWQVNRPSHGGKWGEGPVNLAHLAWEAVAALEAARNDGSGCGKMEP